MVEGNHSIMKVKVTVGETVLEAELFELETAKMIYDSLPIESSYSTWGDEFYFPIPVELNNEAPVDVVSVGDLAYWPDGRCFCIFFGRTPASTGDEPRPASPVTVFGRIQGDSSVLRAVSSDRIIVERDG